MFINPFFFWEGMAGQSEVRPVYCMNCSNLCFPVRKNECIGGGGSYNPYPQNWENNCKYYAEMGPVGKLFRKARFALSLENFSFIGDLDLKNLKQLEYHQ